MGNTQSARSKQNLEVPISNQSERIESAESDSIDVSQMPSNIIFSQPKQFEDSSSEAISSQNSLDFAISNCLKNGNCITEFSAGFNNEVDKQIFRLRGDIAEAIYSGIMNESIEISEIPMDCDYFDL